MRATKKDYVAIAAILADELRHAIKHDSHCSAINSVEDIATNLANYFESNSPLFDRDKFIVACNGE